MKASVDLSTMIGWQAERFARTKNIRTIYHWMKATKPKSAESGARDVKRMFDRMIAKQAKETD